MAEPHLTKRPRICRGFTLIELVITLSVASILLAIAVPNFSTYVANNRMVTRTNDLVSHLKIARAQAISRSSPVTVCATTDGATCSGNNSWDAGWIVFTDVSGMVGEVDGSDEVLRVQSNRDPKVTVQGDRAFLRYGPTGTLIN